MSCIKFIVYVYLYQRIARAKKKTIFFRKSTRQRPNRINLVLLFPYPASYGVSFTHKTQSNLLDLNNNCLQKETEPVCVNNRWKSQATSFSVRRHSYCYTYPLSIQWEKIVSIFGIKLSSAVSTIPNTLPLVMFFVREKMGEKKNLKQLNVSLPIKRQLFANKITLLLHSRRHRSEKIKIKLHGQDKFQFSRRQSTE